MKLEVRLADSPPRRWHLALIEQLAAIQSVQSTLTLDPAAYRSRKNTRDIERIFALERRLHSKPVGLGSPADPTSALGSMSTGTAAPAITSEPDVRLDLGAAPPTDDRTWRLEFDSRPGEQAALGALRQGRLPIVTVVRADGTPVVSGRPGSETPGVLALAFDDILAGCISLIVKAVRAATTTEAAVAPSVQDQPTSTETPLTETPLTETPPRSLARHAVRQVAARLPIGAIGPSIARHIGGWAGASWMAPG